MSSNIEAKKDVEKSLVETNELKRQLLVQKKEIERLKQVQVFMELQRDINK